MFQYVPNLRFYEDIWNKCFIGDFLKIKSGRDQKPVANANGNYNVYGTGGVIGKATSYIYDSPTVCIGRKGTIDCPFYLEEKFWCVDTLFYSQVNKDKVVPKFIYYLFETIDWKKKNQSTGVPSLTSTVIENTKVFIPSLKNQTKISNFLSILDSRIHTQNKIIEELKLLKITITNHLIFNNSKLKERIKLGEFAILKNGYAFKSDTYTDEGTFNIITIANVQGKKNIDLKSCNKISYIPDDIQPHQILRNNDILISLTGNVGRVSLVNVSNCLLNQRVGVLKLKNDLFRQYIYQVISSKNFENKMILKGQGAAQKNIGNDDVESFIIPFSQNKLLINNIINLLNCFDKKIAIEEQILNDYIAQKKYLLSNMFI